jgi:HAD superfamily hydrolase (TIGR01549 family)
MEFTGSSPLKAVFFDIGNTLGKVGPAQDGTRHLVPYASSVALLQAMGETLGLQIGIITNIPADMTTAQVETMLADAGLLDLLNRAAIITSRDVGVEKPDPRIFQHAARQIDVPIVQCMFVGEDPAEVAGAQAAGMQAILKPIP